MEIAQNMTQTKQLSLLILRIVQFTTCALMVEPSRMYALLERCLGPKIQFASARTITIAR